MKKMIQQFTVLLALLSLGVSLFPSMLYAYEAAPVALTKQATFVTEKSARLNGQGNSNDVADAKGWFEWGISGNQGVVYETPRQNLRSSRNTLTNTQANIVGLAPSTQYFYRYVAESNRGKDVGQTVYFTTKPRPVEIPRLVIVETNSAKRITTNTAELNGYVSPHGDAKVVTWFEWGTTQQVLSQTPARSVSGNATPVMVSLKKLVPGTLYFYRIVAENSAGRVYGATRVFSTTGVPPALEDATSEVPKDQNVQQPDVNGDGVERNVSTDGGAKSAEVSVAGTSKSTPRGLFDFFRKKDTAEETSTEDAQSVTTNSASEQSAGIATTESPLGLFWDNLLGKSPIVVTIEKVGPRDIPAHSPVEYVVSYTYKEGTTAKNARLAVTLPKDVVYIGDNTANELMIQEGENGERTYVLPLGSIKKNSARTFSLLGMTTGSANGFPDARAWLEYENASGVHVVDAVAGKSASTKSVSSTAEDKGGILPSSILGWLLYAVLIVGAIIGVRKGKEYYVKRKEEIAREENDAFATEALLENTPTQIA